MASSFAWAGIASALNIHPGMKVGFLGDSITGSLWYYELLSYWNALYGDAAPTWVAHSTGGINVHSTIVDPQVANGGISNMAAMINDAPDAILIELATNDFDHATVIRGVSFPGDVTSLITQLRAGIPGVKLAWIGVFAPHNERWDDGLAPDCDLLAAVTASLTTVLANMNVPYIDVHKAQQADEKRYTASPGVQDSNLTYEGTHPNWRGRPLYGKAVREQINWTGVVHPDVDNYNPTTDVIAPVLWLRADSISSGLGSPVSSWRNEAPGGGHDFAASGAARPTLVSHDDDHRVLNGGRAVRFDGAQNAMTSNLLFSGAKTVFMTYRLASLPLTFGAYFTLLVLTDGSLFAEMIPAETGVAEPRLICMHDIKLNLGDGNFNIGSNSIAILAEQTETTRLSTSFRGGSSTDLTNYTVNWGALPMTLYQQAGAYGHSIGDKCSLGARVDGAGTLTHAMPGDVSEILVFPGVLSTGQYGRVDQYLQKKWGP